MILKWLVPYFGMVLAWPKPISLLSQVVIEDDYYKVWAAADQPSASQRYYYEKAHQTEALHS